MNKKGVKGFRGYAVGVMILILFIFFTYNFIGGFITETNPDSELLNPIYGVSSVTITTNTSLVNIQTSVNKAKDALAVADPDPVQYLFVIARAMFDIPKAVFIFIVGGLSVIPTILFKGMGGTGAGVLLTMTLSIIASILIITLVLLTIKMIRSGESES